MATFKMNVDKWDVEFTPDDDIEILEGAEECTQDSRFRTQIIAGEMFDNTLAGVPWLTDMVSPALSIDDKKQILRRVILSTPNAVKLNYINISVDTEGTAKCDYEGVTTNNEVFRGALDGVNN